jgi:hypothetical protein
VYVLRGGRPGALGAPLYLPLEGDRAAGFFGASVACIGDVDGDGASDFAVGACGQAEGGLTPGMVHAFSGLSGKRLWSARGESLGDQFGRSVTSAAT